MHTREGTTIVTQREKVKKETRQQMNNLFQRLCSVRSFCCRESIFSYLRRAVFILSQANFYSIHFLKVRHFPGKTDNKPLPGVFLEASLPLQQTFKTVLRPIFIWRGASRDFVARLTASRPKKLAPLAKKLVKLDSAVVSMVFQELCHLLAIFLEHPKTRDQQRNMIQKSHKTGWFDQDHDMFRLVSLDQLKFFDFVKFTENIGLPAIQCFENIDRQSN